MINIVDIVDFFGFLFILIAAFTISSKYAGKAKVRLFVFSSYLIACFFLAALGVLVGTKWFIAQQIILMFINVRGIYRALIDMGKVKPMKEYLHNIWKKYG